MICVLFHIYIGKRQKPCRFTFKLLVTFEFEKIYSITTNTFLAVCPNTMSQCVKNRGKIMYVKLVVSYNTTSSKLKIINILKTLLFFTS